jgi:hypothetical protein
VRPCLPCYVQELSLFIRVSAQIKKWNMLGRQRDRNVWEMVPAEVNAYYEPPANEVRRLHFPCKYSFKLSLDCVPRRNFATSFFQGRLVRASCYIFGKRVKANVVRYSDRPLYMSYGAIGAVAAHELTVRWPDPDHSHLTESLE